MRNIKFINSLFLFLSFLMISGCRIITTPQKSKSPTAVQIVTESPNYFRAIVWNDVCFYSEGHYLSATCWEQLPKLVKALSYYPEESSIHIIGYRDNISYNGIKEVIDPFPSLIAMYLWQNGFPAKRFVIKLEKEPEFLSSNRNIGSSCANRRVEVIVERESK